tara:strand:- start:1851 stop:2759 length:909 start_codon:yes stop_codon:yes gene_type:complete
MPFIRSAWRLEVTRARFGLRMSLTFLFIVQKYFFEKMSLSAYELERQKNIERNQSVLQQLGLHSDAHPMRREVEKKEKKKKRKHEETDHEKTHGPTREPSARRAGKEPVKYSEVDLDEMDRIIMKKQRNPDQRNVKPIQRYEPPLEKPLSRKRPNKSIVETLESMNRRYILSQLPPQEVELPSNKALMKFREYGVTSQHLKDSLFPDASIKAFEDIEQKMPFNVTCRSCYQDPSSCICTEYKPMEKALMYELMPYHMMILENLDLSREGAKPKVQCPSCNKYFALTMQAKKTGGAMHGHMCV